MDGRTPFSVIQPQSNCVTMTHATTPKKSLSMADSEDHALYKNLLAKGRTCAAEGALDDALAAYKQAYKIRPTEKIEQRIKKIKEVLKELEDEGEGNEDFVELDNGLIIYRELVERLYPHQIEGIKWMFDLKKNKKKGGILADDMGLGKTIQVISFLSAMFDMELIQSVLLVLPLSLIPNWEKEFEKWAPGIKTKQFYGSVRERTKALEYSQRKPSVCLTTYGLVQTKWEQLGQTRLRKEFVWDYIILDEGHKIKNPTKTTKGLHAIPSRNRLILTGTPIQNNLRELWALFDWVMQGTLLGTQKTFRTEYEIPITRARQRGASAGEIHLGNYMSESLRKIVDPYILRRTKGSVSAPKQDKVQVDKNQDAVGLNHQPSFPKLERKNDFVIWTYLSGIQEEIYRDFLAQDSVKELLASKRSPLVYLTILKKICDHPRLLARRACQQLGLAANDSLHEEDFHTEVGKECAANRIDNISDETLIEESGKLQFLLELLKKLQEEGHRTLIFSLSRKLLNIIHRILKNNKFKVMRLDGTISKLSERELRVKKFQQDSSYDVFLLTTQVGGVGLTLTAADRVVIYDPSWNPATDAQAVDRIYRIGQEKNVVVYRLITCGTVEEKIYRRQIFKDSIIKQSTGDNKDPYRYFTNHDLKELFQLESTRESMTQQQLQDLHSEQRCLDPDLDAHLAFLHTLSMYGVSDHDLMFSTDPDDVEPEVMEDHKNMIQSKVAQAKDRIQAEARQFNGQEEAEQRWGGFDIEEKIKSPPRPKENEPVYEIEGLYDKLDSLKVEEDVVENIFNSSKLSSHNSSDHNNPVCISDSEDELGEDFQEQKPDISKFESSSSKVTSSPAEDKGSKEMILVDDSPAKEDDRHNTSDMEDLEVGESFVSDFDMDESTQGFTRIGEELKERDVERKSFGSEESIPSDFDMDEATRGFSTITADLKSDVTMVKSKDGAGKTGSKDSLIYKKSTGNLSNLNKNAHNGDLSCEGETGMENNAMQDLEELQDENSPIDDHVDPFETDISILHYSASSVHDEKLLPADGHDLDSNITNSEYDEEEPGGFIRENKGGKREDMPKTEKQTANLGENHEEKGSGDTCINNVAPTENLHGTDRSTEDTVSHLADMVSHLSDTVSRLSDSVTGATDDNVRDETSFGRFYFSGSSETSRSNTPATSRPTTPGCNDSDPEEESHSNDVAGCGFIRSEAQDEKEQDDDDLVGSESSMNYSSENSQLEDNDNSVINEHNYSGSTFKFSPLNEASSRDEDRVGSLNDSVHLDHNYEDSPWNSKEARKRKLKRRSTALPKNFVLSDEEDEENDPNQYRESVTLDSSDEEDVSKLSALMLSIDSEDD